MSVDAADQLPDQLRVRVDRGEHEVVVHIDGELDPHTAPLLQREIDALVDAGTPTIVLDLSRLDFVDSSGLRVLIRAHQHALSNGGRFVLRNPSATALRLLEITGLTNLLEGSAS
jgi:anti-sigma B factor antagonist